MRTFYASMDLESNPNGELCNIEEAVDIFLGLFSSGTIFTSPEIVENFPELVKSIPNKGLRSGTPYTS